MSRARQSKYPEWENLITQDPDAFLLPAESELIDPSLFWYARRKGY